jgi:hypothetical protein
MLAQALRDGMVLGLMLGIAAMLILGLGAASLLAGIGAWAADPFQKETGGDHHHLERITQCHDRHDPRTRVLGLMLGIAAMLILGLGAASLLAGIGVAPALVERPGEQRIDRQDRQIDHRHPAWAADPFQKETGGDHHQRDGAGADAGHRRDADPGAGRSKSARRDRRCARVVTRLGRLIPSRKKLAAIITIWNG